MTLHPQTLDEIDFWDLDMFVAGEPHDAYRVLREQAPVWWHERDGGEPFWAVSRYELGRSVFIDPRRFSSAQGIALRNNSELERAAAGASGGTQPMIHTDPPRHQLVRKLIARRFTPRAVSDLEGELRRYARRCMDEAAEKQDIDFVTDIAHRIPAGIAFFLLGVPEENWDRLAELEHMVVTRDDPEFTHGETEAESAANALAAGLELGGFFHELVGARFDDLGDDLISQFLRGRIDGEQLSPEQVVSEAGLLLAGGLDTTRAAASAGAMLPLLDHPDQLNALADDPSKIPTAVEEFIRWASPVMSEARTVKVDTELGGQTLCAGERVVVWTASCNRDEDIFTEPFHYDTARRPNQHLAFSYGEHFCLGAHLARLTLVVELSELLTRFRSFELTGEPVRVRSNFVGGLKHLPMRVVAR